MLEVAQNKVLGGDSELSSSAPLPPGMPGGFHAFEHFNTLVFGPPDPGTAQAGFSPDTSDLKPKL